jgi:hypothetical protein
MRGVRHGIRLRSVVIGGRRFTTRLWLQEFIKTLNSAPEVEKSDRPQPRGPRQRRKASERAAEELRARWEGSRRAPGDQGRDA